MAAPRIRTLKPEFWSSPQIMNICRDARLLFIGLITQADDEGRGRADPRKLRAAIFPGDEDMNAERIRDLLAELARERLAVLYTSLEHGVLFALPAWKRQQVIDRAKASVYPAPSDPHQTSDDACERGCIVEASPPHRRHIDEASTTTREGSDRIGSEGIGSEGIGEEVCSELPLARPSVPAHEVMVMIPLRGGQDYRVLRKEFEHWRAKYPSLDTLTELRRLAVWNTANPRKRKTVGDIGLHIDRWLAKSHDRDGGMPPHGPVPDGQVPGELPAPQAGPQSIADVTRRFAERLREQGALK